MGFSKHKLYMAVHVCQHVQSAQAMRAGPPAALEAQAMRAGTITPSE